jgi:hypothetical protein
MLQKIFFQVIVIYIYIKRSLLAIIAYVLSSYKKLNILNSIEAITLVFLIYLKYPCNTHLDIIFYGKKAEMSMSSDIIYKKDVTFHDEVSYFGYSKY